MICPVRPGREGTLPPGAEGRACEVTDPAALARDGVGDLRIDALISCLASRTGTPAEAWAIDHAATVAAIDLARAAGARQAVLLSAICVQRPRLAFQEAKLRAEAALQASGLIWSIVRPTAYFKSLVGQVARVQAGRPYLMFGDGRLTACTPISDADLAAYLADCLDLPERQNRILPIGGPGPALTPVEIGEMIFRLTGRPPRTRRVTPRLLTAIAGLLDLAAWLRPRLAAKAELARIGHYYATESMLVLNPATGRYDRDLTPATGQDRLEDYLAALVSGAAQAERREHAVF